jgi:hypothetical protein
MDLRVKSDNWLTAWLANGNALGMISALGPACLKTMPNASNARKPAAGWFPRRLF